MPDSFQSFLDPLFFRRKPQFPVKPPKSFVALSHIKPDHMLELPHADRTEVQGACIALIEMIGSVHDTSEEDAVFQEKHMGSFMGQDFTASPQEKLFVSSSPFFPIEDRIIARKAEDPNAMSKGNLAEHKIPERIGVEVFHGNPEQAIGVIRESLFEQSQAVAGQDLKLIDQGYQASIPSTACH